MNSTQSSLFMKRQSFRKEIRRQKLQQKFRKIRVNLYEQYQTSTQNEQMKSKVQETIELILMREYYFVKVDRREGSDNKIDQKLQYFMGLNEIELTQPSPQLRRLLEHEPIQTRLNSHWRTIYNWQQQCSQTIQTIIKRISTTWSRYSYRSQILSFILQTVQFLNYGNRIRQLRRISTRQIDERYLVGQPERCYRLILRRYCQNLLMNFTACEDDCLLLAFLSQISTTIKSSPDFALIYHNIFLTNNIPIGQKLSIFKDFINFLQTNPTSMRDNDTQYIKIIYLVYGNEPSITRVSFNADLKSVQLGYRCLSIMDNYLGVFSFKVEECYGEDSHGEEYATIMEIALILECICREEVTLISKLPQKQNIVKFIINRLKQISSVPQIKSCYYTLKTLSHLSTHNNIFMQISYHYPVLDIELWRVFDKFYGQLFLQNNGIEQQSRLRSQMGRLQLECVKQIIRIFKINVENNEEMSFKYLSNKLVTKLMRICQYSTHTSGIKSLIISNNLCIQIFCSIIHNLLRYTFHQSQFHIDFEPVDILIGEFFFSQQQQIKSLQKRSNLLSLIEIEFQGGCNYDLMEVILQMLGGLLKRVIEELEYELEQGGMVQIGQGFNKQKLNCLQRNKWFLICKEYAVKSNITQLLSQLLYNSSLKGISNNSKLHLMISQTLEVADRISQFILTDNFTNNNNIQLQK